MRPFSHSISAAYQPEHVVAPIGRKEVDAIMVSEPIVRTPSRRRFLEGAGILGGMAAAFPAWADTYIDLDLPGGPDRRELTTAFPQKAQMILQRTRPPLLETPFEVFDRGVFTPNDQFFVRWHWAVIPENVNGVEFKVAVRGHVEQALSLSLADLLAMPRVEVVAVCQCSGNSRGFFQPRVAGAQCGRMGPWEMLGGPASACATSSIARGSRPGLSRFDPAVWTIRSCREHRNS